MKEHLIVPSGGEIFREAEMNIVIGADLGAGTESPPTLKTEQKWDSFFFLTG